MRNGLRVLGLVLALPAFARAESASSAEPPDPQWRHYGWQTALVDGVTGGTFATGAALLATGNGGDAVAFTMLFNGAAFIVATPIVHASHGRGDVAAASFGMRTLGVAGTGFTGFAIAPIVCIGGCKGELGGLMEAIVGTGIGMGVGAVAASVVDALVLAREPVRKPESPSTLSLVPGGRYEPTTRTTTLTLGGSF